MVKSKKDEIYTIVIHEVEKLPETNEAQGRGSNTSHHFSNSNLPRWDSPGRHSEVSQKKPADQWLHIPYPPHMLTMVLEYAHLHLPHFYCPVNCRFYIPAPW